MHFTHSLSQFKKKKIFYTFLLLLIFIFNDWGLKLFFTILNLKNAIYANCIKYKTLSITLVSIQPKSRLLNYQPLLFTQPAPLDKIATTQFCFCNFLRYCIPRGAIICWKPDTVRWLNYQSLFFTQPAPLYKIAITQFCFLISWTLARYKLGLINVLSYINPLFRKKNMRNWKNC